jgi:predicted permease
VALSLVLLMGAGLLLRTIANLRAVDLGFIADRLVVADVNPHWTGYRGDRAVEFSRGLLEKLEVLPGVSSVSLSEHGVLTGKTNGTNLMRPEGFDAGPNGFPQTRWDVVGPQYFSTIGTPLVAGRDFSDRDDAAAPLVVAINEEMARLFFGDASPIGQRLVWGVGEGQTRFEIVAVARDVKQAGPREERQPRFYLPHLQLTRVRPGWVLGSTHYLVRAAGNPVGLAPAVRRVLESEDPRLSIVSLDTAPELVNRALVRERMVATLLVAFGVVAVGLACLGLYGVIAYHVAQRTNEIGVRLALGAQRVQVLSMMLYRPVIWIGAGVAVGIPAALVASRAAQDLLFELSATDAVSLSGAACAISVMGLLAAYISARRALRVEPLVALRGE